MRRFTARNKRFYGIAMAFVMLVTMLFPPGFARTASAETKDELVYWSGGTTSDSGTSYEIPATRANAANTAPTRKMTLVGASLSATAAGPNTAVTAKVANSSAWTNSASTATYWQVSFSTLGYEGITVSSRQYSSGTGPRDFQLQYSADGGANWTDVADGAVAVGNGNWNSGGVLADVQLPSGADDSAQIDVRWLYVPKDGTYYSAAGNAMSNSGGASRIAEVYVKGTAVGGTSDPTPEPTKTDSPAAGKITFSADDYKTITGAAGAVTNGATVYFSLDGTTDAGSTLATDAGAFTYTLESNPGGASTVYVFAKDGDKDPSDKVAVSVQKTTAPAANKITFANATTVTGAAGAVPNNAAVNAYFDDNSSAGAATASATGTFSLTLTNPDGKKTVYITAKEAGKAESDKTAASMVDSAPVSPGDVVFSQLYVNGGNSGAFYKTKFFELYNRTDRDINLSGWSIGYNAATASAFSAGTALSGTIKAHGYFLVTGGSGTTGLDLPVAADQTTSLGPSGSTGGLLFLAHKTTALANDADPELIDLAVYGNGTNTAFKIGSANWGTPFYTTSIGSGTLLRKTDIGSDPRANLGLGGAIFSKDISKDFVMNIPALTSNPQEIAVRNTKYQAQPNAAKISFANAAGTATASGAAGSVPGAATVKAYFEDAGVLTLAGQTAASADGSFSLSASDAANHGAVYLTHTISPYGESAYARIDASADTSAVKTIASLRTNDANGLPIAIGYDTTIEGTATTGNQALGSENTNFFLQDATGGIQVLAGTVPSVAIAKDHAYRVAGRVVFTAGTTQFLASSIAEIESGTSPAVESITLDKLSAFATAEPLEGKLVSFKAKVSNIPAEGPIYNITVVDDQEHSAIVRVLPGSGIDIAGGAITLDETFTFTGVLAQSKGASPYTGGYLLMPRSMQDVQGQLQFNHTPLTKAYIGTDLTVKATAKYADTVKLFYKSDAVGAEFAELTMLSADKLNYGATVPKASIPASGKLLYYIEASGGGDVLRAGSAGSPIALDVVEDKDGPAVGNPLPAPNDEIETQHPEVYATWEDPNGIDLSGIVIKIDDTDYTAAADKTVESFRLSLTNANDLSFGTHTVSVAVKDLLGNTTVQTWTFKVAERFTGGNHYYGTTHNHTNISHDADGKPEDALLAAQAHDYDWFAFSDHSHDIDSTLVGTDTVQHKGMPERTGGTDWQLTKDLAKQYTKNGSFVVFPAFEMTSTTWGHSNVFGTDNFIDRKQDGGKYQDLKSYYAWVLTYDNIVAQFNHPGMSANAFDNFIPYDKNVDKLFTMLEVGNGSGKYSYVNVEDKFFNALDLGWHVAPTFGEDNHDATWGQTKKRTVIVAKDLSMDSLMESMRKMRVYFTEDPNAKLDATASGWYMGSTVDTKTLDFDIKFSDGVREDGSDPKYKYLGDKVKANDTVTKAELITNGGVVVDTFVPTAGDKTSFEWKPAFTVAGGQQWFVVRVTQADGDRIYSAPFWSPEVPVSVKVSNVTVAEGAVVGGFPATLQAGLSNMGTVDVTNIKAKFYYDDVNHPIGEAAVDALKVGQSATASVIWSAPVVGNHKIVVALSADQDLADYSYQQSFTIKAPLNKTIMIDASKNNENTTKDTGTYKDNLKAFTTQMRQQGFAVQENAAALSDSVLAAANVLYISHPASAYSADEIAAIKKFVDGGGAVWFADKSNYGSGSNQNLNPVLSGIGSTILINNDGIADETTDGNFWSTPLTSNYSVRLHPTPVSNYLTDFVSTIEYYSGASLAKNDGSGNKIALTDSDAVTVLAKGNESTFQISGSQIKSDTKQYLVSTSPAPADLTGGSIIPAIASEKLAGGGRIVVSGMNVFNDKQMDESYNEKGNNELAVNTMKWLAHLDQPITDIADARKLPEGTDVVVQGKVTTAAGVFFDAAYVQDETGGIMAFNEVPEGTLKYGDVVRVYGHIKVFENNTELEFDKFDNSIVKVSSGTPVLPKLVSTKDVFTDAYQGQLVKVVGTVTAMPDRNSIYVNDGSGDALVFVDGYIENQSGATPAMKVGDTLEAVGLSGKYAEGNRIRVRDTKELVVTPGDATAQAVADTITSIPSPELNATALTLPAVPEGFGIAISSSSDETVIALDGTVTPPAAETAVDLVLRVTRTSDHSTADTQTIRVVVPAKTATPPEKVGVDGIALNAAGLSLKVGETGILTAVVTPANATDKSVTWTTSDATIATVEEGVVTAVDAGRATITATTVDGGLTATAAVDVTGDGTPPSEGTTAAEVAAGIASIASPNKDATKLTLPTVPEGFSIAIKSSDNANVIDTAGNIKPPSARMTVGLVLTVTRLSDGAQADTSKIVVEVPAKTSTTTPPTTNPTPTPTADPTEPAAPTTLPSVGGTSSVPAEQLQVKGGGPAVVKVTSDTKEVKLPGNAAELLADKKLNVDNGQVQLEIPSGLVQQLTNLIGADDRKGSEISLKMDKVEGAAASALLAASGQPASSSIAIKGPIYDFSFGITTADGGTKKLSKFDQPITLHLKVDADADPNLTGLYYIADSGALEYVGGTIVNGELVVDIGHFSKYAVLQLTKTFADLPSTHWAHGIVQELAAKQIIGGTSDTTFEPGRLVTRAEFASMLVHALKLTATADVGFTDVKPNAWYANDVAIAYAAGIVNGKSAAAFDPNGTITREEMVVMAAHAYEALKGVKLDGAAAAAFPDADRISAWAKPYVNASAELGLVKGRATGGFEPKGVSTRAEAAQVIYNLIKK